LPKPVRRSEQLLADLATVWEEHGVSVLQRLAVTDPGKLAQIAYGLLPRDVFISVAADACSEAQTKTRQPAGRSTSAQRRSSHGFGDVAEWREWAALTLGARFSVAPEYEHHHHEAIMAKAARVSSSISNDPLT
jgi:hypothetical protein